MGVRASVVAINRESRPASRTENSIIEVGAEADAIISVVVPVSASVFALMMAA